MADSPLLTSAKNPLLKQIRKAVLKGDLTEDGLIVAEGVHLLEEALVSRAAVEHVLVRESAANSCNVPGCAVHVLEDALFDQIASTETTQGVMALVRPPVWSLEDMLRANPLVMVLDGVQDPGNAGTILRSAEAFGATGMALLKGCVNPYNPKAVRASAGSIFRVPVVPKLETLALISALIDRGVMIYAAAPRANDTAAEVDLTLPSAIVIGSEGQGVSKETAAAAHAIKIPTGRVESLNAAVSAAILLYEAQRQRMS